MEQIAEQKAMLEQLEKKSEMLEKFKHEIDSLVDALIQGKFQVQA